MNSSKRRVQSNSHFEEFPKQGQQNIIEFRQLQLQFCADLEASVVNCSHGFSLGFSGLSPLTNLQLYNRKLVKGRRGPEKMTAMGSVHGVSRLLESPNIRRLPTKWTLSLDCGDGDNNKESKQGVQVHLRLKEK